MACFIVPAVEAVFTTVVEKVIEKKEVKSGNKVKAKTSFSGKLKWLNNMLWGGSALLAFEHLWHGEIVPWFPFLTSAIDPASRAQMIHEMSTVGVTMAVLVTGVWVGVTAIAVMFDKKVFKQEV